MKYVMVKSYDNKIVRIPEDKKEVYLNMQEKSVMTQLHRFSENFEKEIIDSNSNITEQKLEQEKKLYLERRHQDSIH